ncbi:hypothetical protein BV25DRAFT_1921456 [Artomyces pyxidatus]|uniref:Uncharacterized protein n=1 Tax=Artomyces pyxidatus TaxID=48021 RepID=A0ACB8SJ68_9AGAM|nr:hypothetical protein BV25DRAFT_1921456 [Artomyces pyxidatus]
MDPNFPNLDRRDTYFVAGIGYTPLSEEAMRARIGTANSSSISTPDVNAFLNSLKLPDIPIDCKEAQHTSDQTSVLSSTVATGSAASSPQSDPGADRCPTSSEPASDEYVALLERRKALQDSVSLLRTTAVLHAATLERLQAKFDSVRDFADKIREV